MSVAFGNIFRGIWRFPTNYQLLSAIFLEESGDSLQTIATGQP